MSEEIQVPVPSTSDNPPRTVIPSPGKVVQVRQLQYNQKNLATAPRLYADNQAGGEGYRIRSGETYRFDERFERLILVNEDDDNAAGAVLVGTVYNEGERPANVNPPVVRIADYPAKQYTSEVKVVNFGSGTPFPDDLKYRIFEDEKYSRRILAANVSFYSPDTEWSYNCTIQRTFGTSFALFPDINDGSGVFKGTVTGTFTKDGYSSEPEALIPPELAIEIEFRGEGGEGPPDGATFYFDLLYTKTPAGILPPS